ncbi:uncharacterized protein LOC125510547 [Triticum urartu]|uniref:uncharacterized protein LOC125510547 n=1 Tax=Triticum urartu TaxID=4572 RepID=UPI002043356E|nr:uncharacterized protein LOC125510547 [Triticum urartu]
MASLRGQSSSCNQHRSLPPLPQWQEHKYQCGRPQPVPSRSLRASPAHIIHYTHDTFTGTRVLLPGSMTSTTKGLSLPWLLAFPSPCRPGRALGASPEIVEAP